MTAQAYDTIRYGGEQWALVSGGDGLFDPRAHGLEVVPTNTANWRGYLCRYEVRETSLILARVDLGLSGAQASEAEAGRGPTVFGKHPTRVSAGSWSYELDMPVPFTGTLTLARDLIQALYEHMGYQPVWKFERVLSLVLRDGHVEDVRDESERWARFRATSLDAHGRPLPPPPPKPPTP